MTAKTESATIKVEEAAALLGIGRQTAYDLAAQGKLPGALRLGRRIVVSKKALEKFLEALDVAKTSLSVGEVTDVTSAGYRSWANRAELELEAAVFVDFFF